MNSRNRAVEQNGNDGVVYLADLKYWKMNINEEGFLELINGDYSIDVGGQVNCPHGHPCLSVYYNRKLIAASIQIDLSLAAVVRHFEENN